MIKTKKQMFIVIGIFALILFLGGTTYAWFTYRSETVDQEMIAGDIYLNLNEGTGEISLTNVFPETAEEARAKNNNFITFNITGKNESTKDIYYDFILDHGSDKASPKTRYRDEDLRFDLVSLDANGDEDEYLLSAVSYETLINRRIYVDTVDANTTSQVTRRYKLRMWLDENVIISDTAPDATYNTTEYKNKYATIKLTVAGDFQEKMASRSLYTIMRNSAVMDNTTSTYVTGSNGINFGAISSDTNGKGVYMRAGTENDAYPIMYYRGDVNDNNVKFANKCWKAVRTTDTGGIKLIYNGLPGEAYERVPLTETSYTKNTTNTDSRWTFDSTDNTWNIEINDNSQPAIEFTVPQGNEYSLVMTGTSGSSCGGTYRFYKNGTNVNSYGNGGGGEMNLSHDFGTLTATDVIKMNYTGSSSSTCAITFKLQMIGQGDLITSSGCNNRATDTHISVEVNGTPQNMFTFNTNSNSPTYVGYMYGTVYPYSTSNWTSGARFGSSFTWNGTNYTLVDDSLTSPNATHHYSCNVTTENGTCTELRYVFYVYNGSTKYYITLTGGDGIEEALTKMQTNTNNSNVKAKIDTWYADNLVSYTNKLEDTIWCNDRSIGRANGWSATGAWGTSDYTEFSLLYGAMERSNYASDTSTVKNQPSLACVNKNDRFTVNNGNGNRNLTYPTALLTEDEMVLAGGLAGFESTFYLYNGSTYYWSLSPGDFSSTNAMEFCVNYGSVHNHYVDSSYGLRPAISLKSSTQVISGTGTVTDPYVIE